MRSLLMVCGPVLLALPLLAAGCGIVEDEDRDALKENRMRWARQNLTDYQYQLRVSCFCPYFGNVTVTVRADTLAAVEAPELEMPMLPQDLNTFKTIDGLFDVAEQAIEEADQFTIQYDAQMGYPVKIDIDYYLNAVDDEITYTAANVRPLE